MRHLADNPELLALERLIEQAGAMLCPEVVTHIQCDGETLPLWCLSLGTRRVDAPAIGYFGGVHGVERIGSQVLIAYLNNLVQRLSWDESLHSLLEKVRLVFVPIVNPGGFLRGTRANPNGIDLMRHAPINAEHRVPWPLGGQRLSSHLPWFRGHAQTALAPEAEALFRVVRERLHTHVFSMAVDCHSGFGFHDRLWFPYARSHKPFPQLAEAYALSQLFHRTFPHHDFYAIEPQALSYTTHGDLWDYLYDELRERDPHRSFLPFTLEMGSWTWMKKNPRQLLDPLGLFNPLLPHRHTRVLRRHLTWFDFMQQASLSRDAWLPDNARRAALHEAALEHWYSQNSSRKS